MIISIQSARYLGDYRIKLSFNTGEAGTVDLEHVITKYRLGKELLDPERFKSFYLDEWPTLVWPNGFDLAPEYLYELAMGKPHQWTQAG